ncbi:MULTISPECIES: DNA repair protein RadA [Candidatus Microthrix]|uniref:DNA repair protein RadA n=1 Tax=Candidatus Neomicrothrix parvicella RN1 TaxID=1229780 RepID=R4Z2Z8_9ACTN|nr:MULTISPECIES: DNA repair protein RadA [Microthrix]NLH64581.1 DNA repair protein RadA [Candidatus Microthrix parvicella]MBK6503838.1 DNA repair protein RadA [Candidatus Microthrix sp.]MBK7019450.1 DNA repair protein RadA [Candidatus Microthrix sp.]MBK7324063.1 DNA repair protein RadA [Candidatus Microthrix sp.]MBL0204421.1 DNA repair protein RadA [Candidatus Microthrix sp.]
MASKPSSSPVFRCLACGHEAHKWTGRCGGCGDWNSLTEELSAPLDNHPIPHVPGTVRAIGDVPEVSDPQLTTGIGELDRTLGGGFTGASVSLIGGEPGVGKSTLLLQAAAGVARSGRTVLYVTAEESANQLKRRAQRLDAICDDLFVLAETRLEVVLARLAETTPALVVVDSVHTLFDDRVSGVPGSVTQVREATNALVAAARRSGAAVVLVGHVTKDGGLAGPRVLEHTVDTVMHFEGDRDGALRLLRVIKHRFGATDRVGMFRMTKRGIESLDDPSGLLLADRQAGVPGSAVVAVLEGHRPVLVEVQALVSPRPAGSGGFGTRTVTGLVPRRIDLILAVLAQRAQLDLSSADVFVSVAGGLTVREPAADLAIAAAVVSSATLRAVPGDVMMLGEVGLTGELRSVPEPSRRISEAARLGFSRIVAPRDRSVRPAGGEVEWARSARLQQVATLGEAMHAMSLQDAGLRAV